MAALVASASAAININQCARPAGWRHLMGYLMPPPPPPPLLPPPACRGALRAATPAHNAPVDAARRLAAGGRGGPR